MSDDEQAFALMIFSEWREHIFFKGLLMTIKSIVIGTILDEVNREKMLSSFDPVAPFY